MGTVHINSVIYENEKLKNKDRKFGSCLEYYPCVFVKKDGVEEPMLFTENELKVAKERALRNTEDFQDDEKENSFFDFLLQSFKIFAI